MTAPRPQASRQAELLMQSLSTSAMPLDLNHRLVRMAHQIDWTALEEIAEHHRRLRVKNRAGRRPHLRALIGAVLVMGDRRMTYREVEDQIRYYAPARYLCGLSDSRWTPDFTTIHDFTRSLGAAGIRALNDFVVQAAVQEEVADPSVAVADTTAQEAAIPYPNEMGLLAAFLTTVMTLSKKGGAALKRFVAAASQKVDAAKKKLREYRLFAKDKAKDIKNKMVGHVVSLVGSIRRKLEETLNTSSFEETRQSSKLSKLAKR